MDVYIALSWERALKENLHSYFIFLFLYTLEHKILAMAQAATHFTGCLYCSWDVHLCTLPFHLSFHWYANSCQQPLGVQWTWLAITVLFFTHWQLAVRRLNFVHLKKCTMLVLCICLITSLAACNFTCAVESGIVDRVPVCSEDCCARWDAWVHHHKDPSSTTKHDHTWCV